MSEDIEAAARSQGWVPEDEWTGPPEQWADAQTFVDRGNQIAPILAARNKKLEEKIASLEGTVQSIQQTAQQFHKVAERSIEKSKAERDAAIQALENERAQAITDGDGSKVITAEREIKKLEAEGAKEQQDSSANQMMEKTRAWAKANPWYVPNSPDYNEDKRIYADGVQDRILNELPHLRNDLDGFFKELSRRVEERFKETNPNRELQSVDKGGKRNVTNTKAKTFANLPDEAKEGFAQMKQLIPELTEEQYLRHYTE